LNFHSFSFAILGFSCLLENNLPLHTKSAKKQAQLSFGQPMTLSLQRRNRNLRARLKDLALCLCQHKFAFLFIFFG